MCCCNLIASWSNKWSHGCFLLFLDFMFKTKNLTILAMVSIKCLDRKLSLKNDAYHGSKNRKKYINLVVFLGVTNFIGHWS